MAQLSRFIEYAQAAGLVFFESSSGKNSTRSQFLRSSGHVVKHPTLVFHRQDKLGCFAARSSLGSSLGLFEVKSENLNAFCNFLKMFELMK